ncbi:PQQ-dependent dehydrogenase, methanol/ethanol family [Variovorax rhizosphaerae]|uniref:PQQ-dependent dehydrogenase, methanol/ethanol family n=2 Tax=Variovorax rhizosphaerae TaxID=1836200 RepID=A0ABU8WHQ2_9BURK
MGAPIAQAQATDPGTQARLAATQRVDSNFIRTNGAGKTADWPSYGLDYAETRFSKLDQVNAGNVKQLGLAWSYNLESTRGVEATPLVVDGIMYVTASWSVVHAIDTRTGQKLWTFDPKVDKTKAYKGCCDVVNRGVAIYEGKVYFGAFDGRLIALDAATGKMIWEKNTVEGQKGAYSITGAPRVIKGKVVIGNSGAEYGVRGFVTAYDAKTGAQKWRWFVVPGDPSKPLEDASMAKAVKTWDPSGKYWEAGGGGTAWDSITYDPELNLMYVGTGNGSPWSHKLRSPKGGDNLYLSSIVAINPDTGKYVWHYQETPGDNWDYTATQPMILANLKIEGKSRKVIMHAPKNGFFFVIDRTNGKFISAKNFVPVNWATGYDKNGRPIEVPAARDGSKPYDAIPGPYGAHNWQSMSFNPQTGLAYFPSQHIPINLMDDKDWKFDQAAPAKPQSGTGWNTAKLLNVEQPKSKLAGRLVAWDPVAQKEAWGVDYGAPSNGGTLTTAGNLVFQGTADGRMVAYNAKSGEKLWEAPTGTGVLAAPVTYLVDGKQYVSVAVGWGGNYGIAQRHTDTLAPGTVYTFAVGGTAKMPDYVQKKADKLVQGVKYDPAKAELGTYLYVEHCLACHGVPAVNNGGTVPNLGYLDPAYIENLDKFILKGPATERGMPDFTGKLSMGDIDALKAFIQGTADAVRPK